MKKSITFTDMYKHIDIDVDYGTYKRVLSAMCKVIAEKLLSASEGFKMPYGLGYILIVKYKPASLTSKSLSVDYKASAKYGKKIYHLNEHSDGYKFRLFWSRAKGFPDRYKYQLSLVRQNKRKLAKFIFDKHDYIDINDIQLYKV